MRADGKGRIRQMGVDVDERIPGIAKMAEAIHAQGALVGVELNHGGRTAQGSVSGFVPVAPSPIPCAVVGGEMPEQLDGDDIEHIIECFGEAAARCQQAGVDVISLHGGHGYLIHQFLSPAYNHRDDEWADPALFVNKVIDAVRAMAPGIALGLRFSAFEAVDGGLDAETTRARIDAIATDRLDFLDVSAGNYESGQWIIQPGEWPRGLLAPFSEQYTRDFDLPVGVAGRISSPEVAAQIIESGQADFVSMARTLHADPGFPNRALDGGRYRPCIACNYCIDSLAAGPVPCSVNPWVGRELEQPSKPADVAVHVAVVGGGPSGMAAARDLALAGHRVDLYDERGSLGGDFALASRLHEYPSTHGSSTGTSPRSPTSTSPATPGRGSTPPHWRNSTTTPSCSRRAAADPRSTSPGPTPGGSATFASSWNAETLHPRRSRSSAPTGKRPRSPTTCSSTARRWS